MPGASSNHENYVSDSAFKEWFFFPKWINYENEMQATFAIIECWRVWLTRPSLLCDNTEINTADLVVTTATLELIHPSSSWFLITDFSSLDWWDYSDVQTGPYSQHFIKNKYIDYIDILLPISYWPIFVSLRSSYQKQSLYQIKKVRVSPANFYLMKICSVFLLLKSTQQNNWELHGKTFLVINQKFKLN